MLTWSTTVVFLKGFRDWTHTGEVVGFCYIALAVIFTRVVAVAGVDFRMKKRNNVLRIRFFDCP